MNKVYEKRVRRVADSPTVTVPIRYTVLFCTIFNDICAPNDYLLTYIHNLPMPTTNNAYRLLSTTFMTLQLRQSHCESSPGLSGP